MSKENNGLITQSEKDGVLLHGAFQVENFGDTLLLMTYVRKVRSFLPKGDIKASNCSAHASSQAGVDGLSRLKAIFRRSPIIFCGGGYLGERSERKFMWGLNLSFRHIILGMAAILMRRRYGFFGVGFGPLSQLWYRKLVMIVVNNAETVCFRDEKSIGYYLEYGGKITPVLAADAILSYSKKDLEMMCGNLKPLKPQGKKVIGLHLMGDGSSSSKRKEIIDHIISRYGRADNSFQLVFFCDNGVGKNPDFFEWDSSSIKEQFVSPARTIGVINSCDYVITTKLHVGICASVLEKKTLSLPLHSKTKRFYSQIGREDVCMDMRELPSDVLIKVIDTFLSDKIDSVVIPESIRSKANLIWSGIHDFVD